MGNHNFQNYRCNIPTTHQFHFCLVPRGSLANLRKPRKSFFLSRNKLGPTWIFWLFQKQEVAKLPKSVRRGVLGSPLLENKTTFIGFLVFCFLVPKMYAELFSCFLEHIDLISKIFKISLDRSSGFAGARLFQNCQKVESREFDIYKNKMILNRYSFFLIRF